MLVPMAADQRKRRLNGPIGFGYREQHKAKKKNSGSLQHDLNLNPHVSHKWDENEKRLVPRGEQIGISWRHLTSVASVPRDKTVLADVLTLPKDVFNLKKLMEILSYGAWESFLTEQERNYLMQFLPGGVEPEQVVQSLLAGDNFHFGNPLLQWGTSLCSGDLHPDAVLRHERSFRANKKAYYSELQKYHNNMIDNLQKLKERCARSKDPETEFLMFRSGGKDVGKDKTEKSEVSSDELKSVSRTKKGERLQKDNFNCGDGAKYMSYVKISKKQHDLVKSMKQSGNSIQSRTLNRVLGNLDNFQVKPYEMFEKEEQNRILEYWSNLANNDLPLAFAKWRKNQSERLQIITSLWQEMDEKLKFLVEDEENENSDGILQNQPHDEGAAAQSSSDDDMDSDLSSVEDHSSQVHSLNVEQDINPMDLNAEDNLGALEESEYHVASGSVEASENLPQCPESDSPINPVQTEELPCSSAMDAWPSAGIADSYCQPSSASIEYTSSNELSLRHPQVVQEHSAHLIGLESNMPVEDLTKDLLHQQCSDMSFFRSYQNQERNELLHSFIKPEDYHEEHRRTGLDFHPTPNMVMESGQFLSGPFREQLQPSSAVEHRQKGQSGLYMHQCIQENFFSDNSRYTIARQEHFSPSSIRNWSNSRTPVPSQLSSVEILNQNWFSSETGTHGGWSGSESSVFSNQSLGNGSNGDQSLYSILSQCTNLQSHAPYVAMGSTDKFIPTANYGEDMGGGIPRTNNPIPQTASPLDYVGGHDAAALKIANMGWMSLPLQTSALHDPTEKPFLRSWKQ